MMEAKIYHEIAIKCYGEDPIREEKVHNNSTAK
jgi:hypothetical protein